MKIKFLPFLLILVFFTAACAGSAATVEAPEPTSAPSPSTTAASAPEPSAQEAANETDDEAESGSSMQFTILPGSSQARFYIDEVLRGEPKRVAGTTEQVLGGISIESLNPLTVTLQPFEIDAGSFITDSSFRNRAISDAILQTGRHPTIIFTPTSIDGLPESAEPGQTYSFEVIGNLTIRETTQPVTFDVTLNAESADRITGSASTTVDRSDFDLNIPSVPQVADVSKLVLLEFDFSVNRSD